MSRHEFKEKYPGSSDRAMRKAIREEIGGGTELFDLLETVHLTRQRIKRGERVDPAPLLAHIETTLLTIRDAMAQDVREMYEFEETPLQAAIRRHTSGEIPIDQAAQESGLTRKLFEQALTKHQINRNHP